MPSGLVLPLIYDAFKALLGASVPLTALIKTKSAAAGGGPAIYDDGAVPQAAAMPYLTIGAGTQVRHNRFGAATGAAATPTFGWNCTLQVKAVCQTTESVVSGVANQIFATLPEGTPLTLTGYESAYIDEVQAHPTIVTTLAGLVTRELPIIFRVRAYD